MTAEDSELCKAEIQDDQGMVPLHRAALNNHVTVVNFLLDQVYKSQKLLKTFELGRVVKSSNPPFYTN